MKTLAFVVVVGLISLLSIMGYSLYLNPPVREVIKEVPVTKEIIVEKPIIVEREVIKEVVKYEIVEKEVPVIEYQEKIVYVEKPKPIQPPVCPRCGKRHW